MEWLDLILTFERIELVTGKIFANQVVQFGAAFSLAALIHGRQVRKAIENSIGQLTAVVKQDLDRQSKRLGSLEEVVIGLVGDVEKLKE